MPGRLLLLILLLPVSAFAKSDSDCGWDGDHIDFACGVNANGPAAGASAPLLGDTLGDNPATLPSEPTPFGLEGRWDSRQSPDGKSGFGYSTVKGFEGLGFGIGTWSMGTFSAPDFDEHFLGTSSSDDYLYYRQHPGRTIPIRLGAAFVFPKVFFPKGIRLSLGGSLGLGQVAGETSPQVGVLLRIYSLGLGFSNSYEHLSASLPRAVISTFSAGFGIAGLYLGYSYQITTSDVNRTTANIASLRLPTRGWSLFAGYKWQKDHRGQPDAWTEAGLVRKLGRHVGLGYEYGEYRFSHSAILQLYL